MNLRKILLYSSFTFLFYSCQKEDEDEAYTYSQINDYYEIPLNAYCQIDISQHNSITPFVGDSNVITAYKNNKSLLIYPKSKGETDIQFKNTVGIIIMTSTIKVVERYLCLCVDNTLPKESLFDAQERLYLFNNLNNDFYLITSKNEILATGKYSLDLVESKGLSLSFNKEYKVVKNLIFDLKYSDESYKIIDKFLNDHSWMYLLTSDYSQNPLTPKLIAGLLNSTYYFTFETMHFPYNILD